MCNVLLAPGRIVRPQAGVAGCCASFDDMRLPLLNSTQCSTSKGRMRWDQQHAKSGSQEQSHILVPCHRGIRYEVGHA